MTQQKAGTAFILRSLEVLSMFSRRWLMALVALAALVLSVQAQKKEKEPKKEAPKTEKPAPEKPKPGTTAEAPKETKGETLLKWKFTKDKPFYQVMTTKTEQTMKVMNNDVKQTQDQTFYFKWTPIKQEGDNWIIQQKIEGVKLSIDIGGSKVEYNSTAPTTSNSQLNDFFKLTLNTKTMKVTKVEGREKFVETLVKANQQMKPLLERLLSEKAMIDMAEPTFAVVSEKEVKKGDSWTRNSTLDMGPIGKYENIYKYTFEGPDKNDKKLDTIKVDTTMVYKPPQVDTNTSGLPFKITGADLKSKESTGTITFNPEKGQVQSSDVKLELSGKLKIQIGGTTTDVELSQVQTTRVETSDKSQLPVPAKKP
jgi:hypothetical protein